MSEHVKKLKARFRRWMHGLRYLTQTHRSMTKYHEGRLVELSCSCGKVFYDDRW